MSEPILPHGAVPSPRKLQWQRLGKNLFVHFGPNTFSGREWGDGKESPAIFNPAKLDCRQWAIAAKHGGFEIVILTAKHHDGFCLWPTRTTGHSVKSSPWRRGRGDVVREFVDACRAEGLKPGLYLSPWDQNAAVYGDSPRYNEFYRAQLTELLSDYGPIHEMWFDGACGEGPNGKRQVYDFESYFEIVRRLSPEAVMFSDAGPDVRWIGNEQGFAGDPNWSTVDPRTWVEPGKAADGAREPRRALQHGDEGGEAWRPGETDVSIRPGWFYHAGEDAKVRSLENLVDLYFHSVGRNSLLLLNVPPTPEGLFHPTDVSRLAELNARLESIFTTDFAAARPSTASSSHEQHPPSACVDGRNDTFWAPADGAARGSVEIDLGAPARINVIRLEEAIHLGQRIAAYHVEGFDGAMWRLLSSGTTIGHQKLDRLWPTTVSKVRLKINRALATPCVQAIGLHLDESVIP